MRLGSPARVRRWSALAVVVAAFAAGCAGGDEQPQAIIQLPPTGQTTAIVLPLDGYSPTPAAQEQSDRAQAALERACLARFGLRWSGPQEADLLAGKALLAARRAERFGLVDADQADRYGYHPPPWSTRAVGAAQEAAAKHEQPPHDVAEVLFGQVALVGGKAVPQLGCRGEAFRKLSTGTDQRSDAALLPRLENEASIRANADRRITAVVDSWRACMREAGYHYSTPAQAARDKRWTGGQPTSREISTARADVDCKTKVGYLRTIASVTGEYQTSLETEHADELSPVKRMLAIRAGNAGRALDAAP